MGLHLYFWRSTCRCILHST